MTAMRVVKSIEPAKPVNEVVMDRELDRIIKLRQLTPLFMPIANTRERKVLGYEALIRGPEGSPLHSPASLFKVAHRTGRLLELELLCREVSIRRFKYLNLPGKLFLNVTPATLLESDFQCGMTLQLLNKVGFDAERMVIEITEQFPIEDYTLMRDATCHYRELGFEVALDDLGAGYAGLRSWSELRPQYVKIDRHFIEGIDGTPIKQEFVRTIQEVARSIQCQVIAEGIERVEEHRTLNDIGLVLQQGYYFSRPVALPQQLEESLFRFSNGGTGSDGVGIPQDLTPITTIRPAIDQQTLLCEVERIFREQSDIKSLPVVCQDRPVGLLSRETFLSLYLNPFGRELHDRKPVSEFMDPNPLILEECTVLAQVNQQINQSDASRVRSDFIVTNHGRYLGTGSIFDLLKLITDLQLRHARHANPLTQLPGNVPFNDEAGRRMQKREPFVVCYLDLDNFKAFNDCYGYERGDQVILLLAQCMKSCIDDSRDFIGHIGGDDFLILFGSEDWQQRCQRIQQLFTDGVLNLYDADERLRGGIYALDRKGERTFFDIATVSIGAALPDLELCRSHHDVSVLATDAKRIAKKQPGNSLFINQRRWLGGQAGAA